LDVDRQEPASGYKAEVEDQEDISVEELKKIYRKEKARKAQLESQKLTEEEMGALPALDIAKEKPVAKKTASKKDTEKPRVEKVPTKTFSEPKYV
jgi:hypothetical protein